MNKFSISEAINTGFNKLGRRMGRIMWLVIVVVLLNLLNSIIEGMFEAIPVLYFLIKVIIGLLNVYFSMCLLTSLIAYYDDEQADLSLQTFFARVDTNMFIKYIITSILFALILVLPAILVAIPIAYLKITSSGIDSAAIGIGLVCLIFLGIVLLFYLSATYGFAAFLILDKKTNSASEAIKISGEITKNNRFKLIALQLVFVAIALLGVLALIVGVLFAVPAIYLAQIHVYRTLYNASHQSPTSDNELIETA